MRLKKIAAIIVTAALLPVIPGICSAAEMKWSFDEESLTVSVQGYGMINDATEITKYLDKAKKLEVLSGVTKIERNVFTDCGNIEEVILPEGLVSIGNNSFSLSENLKKVKLPETLETIGDEAFMGCSSLEEISIPENVSSIGRNAFSGCVEIKSFNVSENSKTFVAKDGMIMSKAEDEIIMYPPGKEDENYTVQNGVTRIHENAFSYNSFIKNVSLPDGLREIGDYAFYFCEGLGRISFGEGLKSIGNYAFYGSKLKSIKIPYGTQSIGKYAFKNSELLSSADIPGTVSEFGENAFYGCHEPLVITGFGKALELASKEKYYFNESARVFINGAELETDCPALIINDATMVPMRKIFEALGAEVSWDDATQTASGEANGIKCSFAIGDNKLYKNDTCIELAAPAVIRDGRTLVHVRAIAEAFGSNVEWDQNTGLVTVTTVQ